MEKLQFPAARKVLVAGHREPDGDSISCSIAIYNYYKALGGVDVRMWTCGEVARHLAWMLDLAVQEERPEEFMPDVIIIVDAEARSSRVGLDLEMFLVRGSRIISIDHHMLHERSDRVIICRDNMPKLNHSILSDLALVEMVHPYKVSAASILVEHFGLRDPILYIGIRTDSGNFTRNTLACMRDITKLWISDGQIKYFQKMMASTPKSQLTLEHLKNGEIEKIANGSDDFHLIAIDEDSTVIAKEALAILRMFYPNICLVWKSGMSLRSERIDVGSIARAFGGGGHSRAAGSSAVSLQDVQKIREVIRGHMNLPCLN